MSSRSRSPTWCRCCTAARRPGTRRTSTPSPRSSTPTRPETSTTRRASWARSRSRSTTAAGPRSSRAGSTSSTWTSASTDTRPSQFRAAASSPRAVVPKRPTVGCTPRSGAWLRGVAAWLSFGPESQSCVPRYAPTAPRRCRRTPARRSRSWRPTTPGARRHCSSAAPLMCCSGTGTVRTRCLRKPLSAPRRPVRRKLVPSPSASARCSRLLARTSARQML